MPQKRGDVLDLDGKIIGHHNGALFLTIGERRGFTITKKTDKEAPLYVVAKNIKKNTITVAGKTKQTQRSLGLLSEEVQLKDVNLIGKIPNKKYLCRIRYRQEKIPCKIEVKKDGLKVIFDKPQMGVSAGQSLVLYDSEVCLGGGIIDSTGSL
jgi:tRNA-specific 2-thiouridylase